MPDKKPLPDNTGTTKKKKKKMKAEDVYRTMEEGFGRIGNIDAIDDETAKRVDNLATRDTGKESFPVDLKTIWKRRMEEGD
jgi:hypothetical protein